jgi:hypothetical protein
MWVKSFSCSLVVNWVATIRLNVQNKLDPRGGLQCFLCLNKTLTPPIDAFGALKISKTK